MPSLHGAGLPPEVAEREAFLDNIDFEDRPPSTVSYRSSRSRRSRGVPGLLVLLRDHLFISFLLVFVPFAFLMHLLGDSDLLVFVSSFLSILPLAWLIGKSTEDLAVYGGEAIGAFLNVTFGNAVAVLLCFAGVRENQIAVVQCTLVGSILSNLLLLLGASFLWGSYNNPPPKRLMYSKVGAGAHSTLMLLGVASLALPTAYATLLPSEQDVLDMSRGCSTLLIVLYLQYLIFSLKTHKGEFEHGGYEDVDIEPVLVEGPYMDARGAFATLAVCTAIAAVLCEYLVQSIQGTIESLQITKEFIGIILLPVVGNAAEHGAAVVAAGQNKMDLSVGVAVGSSVQIALLVTPLSTLFGWALARPMSLDFHPFQVAVLLMAVLLVSNVLKDGESNWLEGSVLITAYCGVGLVYICENGEVSSMSLAARSGR